MNKRQKNAGKHSKKYYPGDYEEAMKIKRGEK